MKKIRTRYAPSPTGYLHIGGARTALYNFLFAKHNKGEFVIRIEDTDIERNVVDGEKSQIENLRWLGIEADESPENVNVKYGPYRQSEKISKYQELANLLIEKELAYIAYDNSDEIEEQRNEQLSKGIPSFKFDRTWLKISQEEKEKRFKNKEYSIRIKSPINKNLSWDDLVRGQISFNSNELADWVIIKSNGYPTYNFAVVVDDVDMEISHILRGEEHITNTPKQLMVYQAFGWAVPKFGHLTIITNMEGKKLSKRDLSLKQFIEDYKNDGYRPEAIFNFLALLGWTDKDAKEILSKEELIERFDYKRLSKSPTKFDISKMNWFSKHYLKEVPNKYLIKELKFPIDKDEFWQETFVSIFKESAFNIKELNDAISEFDQELLPTTVTGDVEKEFVNQLSKLDFNIENIQIAINNTKEILKVNGKNLFMPIRKIATNKEHGPELAKAIFLYGPKKIYNRLGIKK